MDGTAEARGHYLSVWKETSEGHRVVLDIGTPYPDQGPLPDPASLTATADSGALTVIPEAVSEDADATRSLLERDEALNAAGAASPLAGALAGFAASGIQLNLTGETPTVGGTALAALEGFGAMASTTTGGEASRSGTLGYTYGTVSGDAFQGHHVRIWRREVGGEWEVEVLVLNLGPA